MSTHTQLEEQTVRIASIKGKGIRKRCRKSEFIYVQAVGMTSEEAIDKLKENLKRELSSFREYDLNPEIYIFDGQRTFWNGHSSLKQVMMPWIHPAEHNFIAVPFESIRTAVAA